MYQRSCSGLEISFLSCMLIENPCEVVCLPSVAVLVALRVFWRSNGHCVCRNCMYAIIFAPAGHAVLKRRSDAHDHLQMRQRYVVINNSARACKLVQQHTLSCAVVGLKDKKLTKAFEKTTCMRSRLKSQLVPAMVSGLSCGTCGAAGCGLDTNRVVKSLHMKRGISAVGTAQSASCQSMHADLGKSSDILVRSASVYPSSFSEPELLSSCILSKDLLPRPAETLQLAVLSITNMSA